MRTVVSTATKLLLTGLFLCCTWLSMYAQNTIRGTVTDENGEPIIGASIALVEDATKGTIADQNGNFSLVASPGNTLRVSSIGFKTIDIKVGNQDVINIGFDLQPKIFQRIKFPLFAQISHKAEL